MAKILADGDSMTGIPCKSASSRSVFIQGIKMNEAAKEQRSIANRSQRISRYWARPRFTSKLASTINAIQTKVLKSASTLKMLPATIPATWRSVRVLKMVGATRYPVVNKLPTHRPAIKIKSLCAPRCLEELIVTMDRV